LINIEKQKDFVINTVSKENFPMIYATSQEFAPEIDEFIETGLTPVKSILVTSPRVKESMISLECRLHNMLLVGNGNYGSATLVVGTVEYVHVDESLMENGVIDYTKLKLVSRLSDLNYGNNSIDFSVENATWTKSNW